MSTLVPFGKYKGKPMEVLLQDQGYCDWLTGQPWFRERYANLNVLIINNGHEPTDTPEHNALQARFLDPEFCVAYTRRRLPDHAVVKSWLDARDYKVEEQIEGAAIPHCEADLKRHRELLAQRPDDTYSRQQIEQIEKKIQDWRAEAEQLRQLTIPDRPLWRCTPAFEVEGWDVVMGVESTNHPFDPYERTARIECKPSLGDDYPTVMRQIKARGHIGSLLIGAGGFTSDAITLDQLRAFFRTASIEVVLLSELLP